jgi:hypothetical protein
MRSVWHLCTQYGWCPCHGLLAITPAIPKLQTTIYHIWLHRYNGQLITVRALSQSCLETYPPAAGLATACMITTAADKALAGKGQVAQLMYTATPL